MAAGDERVFERGAAAARHVREQRVSRRLEPGQGQTVKLLNNLLSATALAVTSEALTFGVGAGLDPATLLEVFNAGTGRNTATSQKFPAQC